MSARRPKGRRKEAVTREKTEAGHVCEPGGMSRARDRSGRMMLKPEMKYSCHFRKRLISEKGQVNKLTDMRKETTSEEQNKTSLRVEEKTSGRWRPSRSISRSVRESHSSPEDSRSLRGSLRS